jgi:hypothetical protein
MYTKHHHGRLHARKAWFKASNPLFHNKERTFSFPCLEINMNIDMPSPGKLWCTLQLENGQGLSIVPLLFCLSGSSFQFKYNTELYVLEMPR